MDGKKSHGPKNVISMLHDYLCNFSLGEKKAVFHADNCRKQNESKTVIHYFTWQMGKGLHQEIITFWSQATLNVSVMVALGK